MCLMWAVLQEWWTTSAKVWESKEQRALRRVHHFYIACKVGLPELAARALALLARL